MVRLTILGDVGLRTEEGAAVGSVLAQPRRFALLVYLALESNGGGISRDRLLGVFWPEIPQDKGRQALRTALHFLRRSLGRDAIASRGDLLSLAPGHVFCDAVAFRDALSRSEREEALRLYGGEMLPGFFVDGGTVEFERWVEATGAALRRDAADAAWALATEQERLGNPAGAGARAREAAELSDGDEAAVRRSIELLARIGDRAGALTVYETFARRLRLELEASPSAETETVIARIRAGSAERRVRVPVGHAALADAPVEQAPDPAPEPWRTESEDPDAPTDAEPVAAATGDGGWKARWRNLVSAGVTLLLVVAFYSLWGLNRVDPAWTMPSVTRPVIQLEEIRDFSADGTGADLAGALGMELAGRLSEIDQLQVVPARGARAGVDPADAVPTYVLSAGIIRTDSVARVSGVILDASSGATLQRIRVERPIGGTTATVDELAETLGSQIRHEVGRAVEDHQRRAAADNPQALALVRSAILDLEAGDSLRRAGAPAAAQLSFLAADSQLAVAQVAAPRWSEPSVQRAEVAFRKMWLNLLPPHQDAAAASAALEEGLGHADAALDVSRDDPVALELRGTLRYWKWQTDPALSRDAADQTLADAVRDLQRATSLDPGRARAWSVLSGALEMHGDFAAANIAARRAFNADAYLDDAADILVRLFSTSLEVGDAAAAHHWCEELARRVRRTWLVGYCELEQLAWLEPQPALAVEDSVQHIIEQATAGPGGKLVQAQLHMLGAAVFARAGHRDAALAAIDRAKSFGSAGPEMLQLEAWARLLLGEQAVAADLLAEAVQANPRGARAVLQSRRFAALR